MPTASASPEALRQFVATAGPIDASLDTAGSRVRDTAAAWVASGPERGAGIASADDGESLRTVGADWAYTTEWVGLVARRFDEADGAIPTPDGVTIPDDAVFSALVPPPTAAEAEAEAAADAAEWEEMLEDLGISEQALMDDQVDLEELWERYPELAEHWVTAAANSESEAYSAAYVDALGADGVALAALTIDALGRAQHWHDTDEVGTTDLSQEVLAPFTTVVMGGLADEGNADIAEELLVIDGYGDEAWADARALSLIVAHADGPPQFVADAAEAVLRWSDGGPSRPMGQPEGNDLFLTDERLWSEEYLVMEALAGNPEASFLFVTATEDGLYTDNVGLLTTPPGTDFVDRSYRPQDDPDFDTLEAYYQLAGLVIENGYTLYPQDSGDPADMTRANDAFEAAVLEVGNGGLPDTIRRSVAAVAATTEKMEHIAVYGDEFTSLNPETRPDGMSSWEVVDDVQVQEFFAELARDNSEPGSALEIITIGVGAESYSLVEEGMLVDAADGTMDFVDGSVEYGRAGSLWGNLGAGMNMLNDAELSEEAAQDALLDGLVVGAKGVKSITLSTTSVVTGGTSTVVGLVGDQAITLGRDWLDSQSDPELIDLDAHITYANAQVNEQIELVIATNPEVEAAIEASVTDPHAAQRELWSGIRNEILYQMLRYGFRVTPEDYNVTPPTP